jgi:hypothetical protein
MKKVFSDKVLEWSSTTLLIVGVVLTSYNIFPLNVWICFIGNAGWIIVGIMWKKISLVIVSVFISMIYLTGLINHYIL